MTESQLQKLMRRASATQPEVVASPEARKGAVENEDDFNPADYDPNEHKSFTTAATKRQPGFVVTMVKNRARYWIYYHSIRRLKFYEQDAREYIEFTHDNLAVTIAGERLDLLLTLIGEGRLKAIFEPAGRPRCRDQPDDGTGHFFVSRSLTSRPIPREVNKALKLVKPA